MYKRFARTLILVIAAGATMAAPTQAGSERDDLLAAIRGVSAEGKGNEAAQRALRHFAEIGNAADLVPILNAMDGAHIRAVNLLQLAGDMVMDRELARKAKLPVADLEAFVLEKKHAGLARRIAFEWLLRVDAGASDRLVPGFINDPAAELRRDAVALELKNALDLAESDADASKKHYLTAFEAARDSDQVLQAAKALQKLGQKLDLPSHLGLIELWHLIGPFDNTDMKGFDVAYPPEKGVDLAAKLKGKKDAEIGWVGHQVEDREVTTDLNQLGLVDLNKALGKHKGAVGYAVAYVNSPREQTIEVRMGSINAVKVFLNGKQVLAQEEYHHGMKLDQYSGAATLKEGRNEILVKVCQNEQTEPHAQVWTFQLRLCDSLGGAIPFEVLSGKKEGQVKP